MRADRASLAYRVIPFLDLDATSRYVLTHRDSGRLPIASSIYETHLAQKSDSQKTRSGSLYGIASLYSWADEHGVDLDARLLSGEGLAPSQIPSWQSLLAQLAVAVIAIGGFYLNARSSRAMARITK